MIAVSVLRQAWSAYREPSFGHGIMEFIDAGTAHFTWNRNQDPVGGTSADKVGAVATAVFRNCHCAQSADHCLLMIQWARLHCRQCGEVERRPPLRGAFIKSAELHARQGTERLLAVAWQVTITRATSSNTNCANRAKL